MLLGWLGNRIGAWSVAYGDRSRGQHGASFLESQRTQVLIISNHLDSLLSYLLSILDRFGGHVPVTNWHVFEPQSMQTGGVSARVEKRGKLQQVRSRNRPSSRADAVRAYIRTGTIYTAHSGGVQNRQLTHRGMFGDDIWPGSRTAKLTRNGLTTKLTPDDPEIDTSELLALFGKNRSPETGLWSRNPGLNKPQRTSLCILFARDSKRFSGRVLLDC